MADIDNIMQLVGLVGAGLLLLAYFNNATKKWTSNNLSYQISNLGGASLICINTYYFNVYGPLILNFFWALIALNGLRVYFHRTDQ
jgi:hypothetical protein